MGKKKSHRAGRYLRAYANIEISGVAISEDIYFAISRVALLYADPSIYPGWGCIVVSFSEHCTLFAPRKLASYIYVRTYVRMYVCTYVRIDRGSASLRELLPLL